MLELKVPKIEELGYRERLLSDKDTMSYNAGYELDILNYDYKTGCIDFNKSYWQDWYKRILGNLSNFYSYIFIDNKPVGEIFLAEDGEISLIIEAIYRNKGYGEKALRLAIENTDKKILINNIPENRKNAIKLFKKIGFIENYSYITKRFKNDEKVLHLVKRLTK